MTFKPALVAEWLKENQHFKTDIETGILYHYFEKSWVPNAEPYLEELLAKILGKENKRCHFNNILHDLRGLTYEEIEFSSKIACPNGLLDVETLKLTPNTPEEMPLFSIPTEYIPNSLYPQWQAWLNEVMPNKDDQKTLQEWSGFIILPDYRFHKMLYNYGAGRNGKGTWERTIQAVVGKNNVSGVSLEELDGEHRFAVYQLYGKLLNLGSEPTTKKILQTSLLKKATGQDMISAERKGSDKRVNFINTAKITVSANKFPKVRDSSVAFVERRLMLNWENEFLEHNGQIQNIEYSWTKGGHDERKGILCWMLEGLQRLLSQGYFTESKSQRETEILFQRASDTISAFLTERGIFNKNLITSRSEAFEAYKNYCYELGLEAESKKRFTSTLIETPRIRQTSITHRSGSLSQTKRERAWEGLGLKKDLSQTPETPRTLQSMVTAVTDVTGKDVVSPSKQFDNSSIIREDCNSNFRVTPVTGVKENITERR